MNIKDIVKDNHVRFARYWQGVAYSAIRVPGESRDRMFPVPLEDVGDGTLQAEDKAIYLMRWIRKSIDEGTFVPT